MIKYMIFGIFLIFKPQFINEKSYLFSKQNDSKIKTFFIQYQLWFCIIWYLIITFIFWLWFSLEVFTFTSKNMFGANAQHSSQLLPSLWEPFAKLVNLYVPCIQIWFLKILVEILVFKKLITHISLRVFPKTLHTLHPKYSNIDLWNIAQKW